MIIVSPMGAPIVQNENPTKSRYVYSLPLNILFAPASRICETNSSNTLLLVQLFLTMYECGIDGIDFANTHLLSLTNPTNFFSVLSASLVIWIRGSLGDFPVGGAWMIAKCAKPEGRLHPAGDFTTMKSGWVEGAIESGLRAARAIDPAAEPEGERA